MQFAAKRWGEIGIFVTKNNENGRPNHRQSSLGFCPLLKLTSQKGVQLKEGLPYPQSLG